MKNNCLWNGNLYWIGICDVFGTIIEMHTIEEAEQADYHIDFYFSEEALDYVDKGMGYVFWIDKNEVDSEDEEVFENDFFSYLKSQIEIKGELK